MDGLPGRPRLNVLIVIPARGGSKGIPMKNLADVGGLPLVARTIMAAKESLFSANVLVSTDDQRISEVSKSYGADVVLRPDELSGDRASSESALIHAANYFEESHGLCIDVLVLLQCTSPFTTAADINGTVAKVVEGGADSAFAAVQFEHFLWKRSENGSALPVNHDGGHRKRRQDTEPQYLEAGSVYAMDMPSFRSEGNRFCGKTAIFKIPPFRCFEIDDPIQLTIAQAIACLMTF